MQGLGLRFKV